MYKLFNCRLFDHQIQQKQTTKTNNKNRSICSATEDPCHLIKSKMQLIFTVNTLCFTAILQFEIIVFDF